MKIDGFTLKDFGGMGLNSTDAGAIVFEILKKDLSIGTLFLVHF